MMSPIKLNISSSNFFLLSGCSMRLRFDLAPASVILNASDTGSYTYSLESAKLWAQKIVPGPAALMSLNRSLLNGSSVSYVHDRPIVKSFVFSAGHSNLCIENPFSGYVPSIVQMVFVKQAALNGRNNLNAGYFSHCNISSVRLEINGNCHSALTGSFPNSIANIFHPTLTNLKSEDNLITLQSFKDGRTIYAWDL